MPAALLLQLSTSYSHVPLPGRPQNKALIPNPFSMHAINKSAISTDQICSYTSVMPAAARAMRSVVQLLFKPSASTPPAPGEVLSHNSQASFGENKPIPLLPEGKGLHGSGGKKLDGTKGSLQGCGAHGCTPAAGVQKETRLWLKTGVGGCYTNNKERLQLLKVKMELEITGKLGVLEITTLPGDGGAGL